MSSQITETSTIVASHYDAVSATAESLEFSDDTIALATTALQYGILSDAQPGDADTDAAHAATDQSDVDNAPHALSAKLAHLVDSVTEVEELSRRAREAAVDDLARYESLAASTDQYGRGLEQARAICVQVRETRDNSFGQAAKAAAEELVAEAEQVLAAFTQLVAAWKAQENSFLATHPDVDLLVAERQALEVEARRQEAVAALARRRDALLASKNRCCPRHAAHWPSSNGSFRTTSRTSGCGGNVCSRGLALRKTSPHARPCCCLASIKQPAISRRRWLPSSRWTSTGSRSTSARTSSGAGATLAAGWPRRRGPGWCVLPQRKGEASFC
jgi:hypothetical protein